MAAIAARALASTALPILAADRVSSAYPQTQEYATPVKSRRLHLLPTSGLHLSMLFLDCQCCFWIYGGISRRVRLLYRCIVVCRVVLFPACIRCPRRLRKA